MRQQEEKRSRRRTAEPEIRIEGDDWIVITKSLSARIPVAEIEMLQHANRRVLIYRAGNPEPVVFPGKLKECIRKLDARFFLCTNTLGINLEQVETMQRGEVLFRDGERVFIGRDNFIRTRRAFERYLEKQGRRSPAFEEKCRKLREK